MTTNATLPGLLLIDAMTRGGATKGRSTRLGVLAATQRGERLAIALDRAQIRQGEPRVLVAQAQSR